MCSDNDPDADDDIQVVVELGETNIWVTLVTKRGRHAPSELTRVGDAGCVPAGVAVDTDGTWRWGVDRHSSDAGALVIGGFLSRVDDVVPLVIDSVRIPATELVAGQVSHVVTLATTGHREPSLVTIVHPDEMSARARQAIGTAVSVAAPIRWVGRAEAAIAAACANGDLEPHDVVASLHVGGSTCVASVWSSELPPRRLGPFRTESACAGSALDDRLVGTLIASHTAPTTQSRIALWSACSEAKVLLSSQTSADLRVGDTPVRLVRTELEEISAPLRERQLEALADALALAGVETSSLRTVLLTGGAAAAPGVVSAAGARFDAPAWVVGRLAATVGHDAQAATVAAERTAKRRALEEASQTAALPLGVTERFRAALDRLGAHVSLSPSSGQPPARVPVALALTAVVALTTVAGAAAMQQARVVGVLASALGSGGGDVRDAPQALARGVLGPLVAPGPIMRDQVRAVIETTTEAVRGDAPTDRTDQAAGSGPPGTASSSGDSDAAARSDPGNPANNSGTAATTSSPSGSTTRPSTTSSAPGTTPTTKPTSSTPTTKPTSSTPASTPTSSTPASTPTSSTPASTPTSTTPASTPTSTTPASTPTSTPTPAPSSNPAPPVEQSPQADPEPQATSSATASSEPTQASAEANGP